MNTGYGKGISCVISYLNHYPWTEYLILLAMQSKQENRVITIPCQGAHYFVVVNIAVNINYKRKVLFSLKKR